MLSSIARGTLAISKLLEMGMFLWIIEGHWKERQEIRAKEVGPWQYTVENYVRWREGIQFMGYRQPLELEEAKR